MRFIHIEFSKICCGKRLDVDAKFQKQCCMEIGFPIDDENPKEKPFFFYIAYTAAHWPLQAPESEVQKYKGVYDKGWDETRKLRFGKLKNHARMATFSGIKRSASAGSRLAAPARPAEPRAVKAKHMDACRRLFELLLAEFVRGRRRFEAARERRLDRMTRKA